MKRTIAILASIFGALPALAQEGTIAAASTGTVGNQGYYALGAGILLGMAALGGTLAQGKVGAAAMDGIARNPQAQKPMFTPMIVAFALIESLVIISWLMANFFQAKF